MHRTVLSRPFLTCVMRASEAATNRHRIVRYCRCIPHADRPVRTCRARMAGLFSRSPAFLHDPSSTRRSKCRMADSEAVSRFSGPVPFSRGNPPSMPSCGVHLQQSDLRVAPELWSRGHSDARRIAWLPTPMPCCRTRLPAGPRPVQPSFQKCSNLAR